MMMMEMMIMIVMMMMKLSAIDVMKLPPDSPLIKTDWFLRLFFSC
jgi:hypothetical protein